MAIFNRGSAPRLLLDQLSSVFEEAGKQQEKIFSKIYKEDKASNSAYSISLQMEGLSIPNKKNEGDDLAFDSRRQSFAPKFWYDSYAKGIIITHEMMSDMKYGEMFKGAEQLRRCMEIGKEYRGAQLFNTAFSTSSAQAGGDGVAMCSTAHIRGPDGGTYSNRIAIDADFSETALEDVLKQIDRSTDSRGNSMTLRPVSLLGHTDLRFEFQRVLKSELRVGTAENDTNAIKSMGLLPGGAILSPFMSVDTDAWFVLTDTQYGLIHQQREALMFGHDETFASMNLRFRAYERDVFGYLTPHAVYGSQGT